MSQKKVDAYKANKKNRGEISRKANRQRKFETIIVAVLIVIGVAYFCVANVLHYNAQKTQAIEIQTEAIDDFLTDIQTYNGDEAVEVEAEDEAPAEEK